MWADWKRAIAAQPGRLVCVAFDAVVMAAAYFAAFLLRFDFEEPWWGWGRVACSFVTVLVAQCSSLWLFGCYRLVWRYVSVSDIPRFVGAVGSSTGILILLWLLFPSHVGFRPPFSITFLNSFLVLGGLLGVRLLWRLVVDGEFAWDAVTSGRARRVILVGAGATGNLVAKELRRQNAARRLVVVGFLDDDPAKSRAKIQGHRILGRIDDLPDVVRRLAVEEVIVSMARAPREVVRRVVRLSERAHVPARIVPGYCDLIDGSVTASKLRNIDVSDLLGRREAQADSRQVLELLGRKRVLVTGAGGTIGSELVRQILRAGPEQLVLVERSENALYEIEREIRTHGAETVVTALLADICEKGRMDEILAAHRPHIVVHAAAHKHVPMMEANPVEAIKNNVLATRELGEQALAHGVERFVFISTDKAVRPVSVMGCAKRLAEVALQDLNRRGQTRFSAVRFGNVLDSSGSVVPLFREQIRKGAAVTVTHPEMTRFFMTISEAVTLVLQAAALAQGGEIFVLDMGEPIRIVDLAEEMIALSGLRPYEDVPIVFTGVRPGEKLSEELDVSERSAYKTGHARIFVCKISESEPRDVAQALEACRVLCSCGVGVEQAREGVCELARRFERAGAAEAARASEGGGRV
jgi:FlaA1/EpsC-like NDP-sugar epimerase